MDKKQKKWAVFWCDLLFPIIYEEIGPGLKNAMLKKIASEAVEFPDGKVKKPSLSTLKRKLAKFEEHGFEGLFRKPRSDLGGTRANSSEAISLAVDIKKDQPKRSDRAINRILEEQLGETVSRSTLYRHLKQAGATRLKLGIGKMKVRGRWTVEKTHDMREGDFSDGPYVLKNGEAVPTYLSAFVDCHSRYAVEARYYYRENLDVLVDSLIRALAKHGAPFSIYVDRGSVYLSLGLRAACHVMNARLLHRPAGDPAPGGLIERFILDVQDQYEAEVRVRPGLVDLEELNRGLAAWVAVAYHKDVHSEIHCPPEDKYKSGLTAMRPVDMNRVLDAFKQRVFRTVNRTFSDVRLNNLFFLVDSKHRGDRVEVAYDPFASFDVVDIYSPQGRYLGQGALHDRSVKRIPETQSPAPEAKFDYIGLLERKHERQLRENTRGIDYRKAGDSKPWPFQLFARTFARLLGLKGGLASLSPEQLEALRKAYGKCASLDEGMVKKAFENAPDKSFPYILLELENIIKAKE